MFSRFTAPNVLITHESSSYPMPKQVLKLPVCAKIAEEVYFAFKYIVNIFNFQFLKETTPRRKETVSLAIKFWFVCWITPKDEVPPNGRIKQKVAGKACPGNLVDNLSCEIEILSSLPPHPNVITYFRVALSIDAISTCPMEALIITI